MATIASSVLAFYVFVLQREFPTIAGHLMSASLLSAPAALVMSKLVMPESGTPETLGLHVKPEYERERSWIEALIGGANAGVKLVVGVVALLLAFLGLVALVDLGLGTAGMWINRWTGWTFDWTLKNLLGYAFYPLTLAIGVPPNDAWEVARLIGERAVVTEVAAYRDLAVLLSKNAFIHPRSAFITTYALCGFAHVASLAIFVGGTAALAPTRTHDLARLGFRALLSATLACLMTAAVAGTFFTGESLLMGR
jgi:CNT family concentrative nucleoside transporter